MEKKWIFIMSLLVLAGTGCGKETKGGDAEEEQDVIPDTPSDQEVDTRPDTVPDGPDVQPDVPTDTPTDVPTDGPTDTPTDVPTDGPTDTPTDVPTDTSTDTSPEDGSDADDGGATITLSGIVNDFFGYPISGTTVSVIEDSSRVATTGWDGRFTLVVPAEAPMTLLASCSGYVDTQVQTAIPHTDTPLTLWLASPENYAVIVAAGGGTATDAVFYITIRTGVSGCDLTGSLVTTSPSTGQVVYGQADGYPNASLTSLPPGSRWAYVIGPTGTTTPELVSSTCTQIPYPADVGPVTVVGPINVRAATFHVMDLYTE